MTRKGFTLIDVVIAMTILAIALTVVYHAFAFQRRVMEAATDGRNVIGQGMFILDRMSKDLTSAWLPAETKENARVLYQFQAKPEFWNFDTTASLSDSEKLGPDLVEVGYRLEVNQDADERKYVLIRRQDETPDDEPESGGSEIVISKDIISLEIQFTPHDSDDLEDTIDVKKAAELPTTAQIKLVLSTKPEEEETFVTSVDLVLANPTVKKIDMDNIGLKLN